MVFTAVKAAHPPTTVEFAAPCSMVQGGGRNLVVVKNTLLELYQLRVQSENTEENAIFHARLELRHSAALFGKVAQMAVVRPTGAATDRLLLAFDTGNLAIVAWDPVKFDFSTVAIQSFANAELIVGRGEPAMCPPLLRADPQNRCAAMLVHDLRLHIVPIGAQYQRTHMDDAALAEDGGGGDDDGNFEIDLEAMGICNVKDFVFLDGGLEPTVCILYEEARTWTGRIVAGRATCSVRTLSLSLPTKEHTDIWSHTDLPYNAVSLSAVAPPYRGAMMIALNTIWYLNTSTRIAVAVNEFGLDDLQESKINGALAGPHDLSDVAITMQACNVCFLDATHALLNLSRGQMFCVELVTEVRNVVSFRINREAAGILTSCTCKLSEQMLFLGSRLADSQLVEFKRHEEKDEDESEKEAAQSAVAILQSLDVTTSIKEALNMLLMELRVALDRSSDKKSVSEALAQAGPKFDSFLAEHGAELPGLRQVCKILLAGCGWDSEQGRWSAGDGSEDAGGSVAEEDKELDQMFADDSGAPDAAKEADGEKPAEPAADEAKADGAAEGEGTAAAPNPNAWSGKAAAIAQLDEAIESLSVFKRRRVGKAATDIDDDLFGMELQTKREVNALPPGHSQIKSSKSFNYTSWDTLPNVGPIADFAVGRSQMSVDGGARLEDIVTCSGHSKNGALYVLHRDVRPQVTTTIPLPGCRAMWSVQHEKTQKGWELPKEESAEGEEEEEEGGLYDAFVLLSMEETDQTMVLKTGVDGLNTLEGDSGGFVIDEETVMAGNVSEGRFIVQVCRSKVVLLDDELAANVYNVENDSGDTAEVPPFICSAAVSDPYVALHLSNASAVLLKSNPTAGRLERVGVQFGAADITSVSLFEDLNASWLHAWGGRTALCGGPGQDAEGAGAAAAAIKADPGAIKAEAASASQAAESKAMDVDFDDEETDIFGDSEPTTKAAVAETSSAAAIEDDSAVKLEDSEEPIPSRHFCTVSREGGVLEVFVLVEDGPNPHLQRAFICDGVPRACGNLHDSRTEGASSAPAAAQAAVDPDAEGAPAIARVPSSGIGMSTAEIRETYMHVLDEDYARPVLACVLDTGDVLLHRPYVYDLPSSATDDSLLAGQRALAFSAIDHDHLFGPTKSEREALQAEGREQVAVAGTMLTPRVVSFNHIGGNAYESGSNGFFVGGARPAWVMCDKECVRVHPMRTDGNVRSFSPLHIPPTQHAFITLNRKNELKICNLDPNVSYGGPWPYRKVGLKATAHKIVYNEETETYTVVTSKQMQAEKPAAPEITDENGVVTSAPVEEDDGQPKAKRLPRIAEQFELRVLSPRNDWDCMDKYELKPDEHVCVIRNLKLTEPKMNRSEEKEVQMVGIGTAFVKGEDKTCEGRLILLAVESTLSGPQIVEQFEKTEKGPVTAMAQLQKEYVVATAGTGIDPTHRGNMINVQKFKTDEEGKGKLSPAAFYHAEVFCSSLTTIKGTNIILLGDPCKSVNCLIWKPVGKRVELLARDFATLEVQASHFVLDDSKQLNVIVSDGKENLQIFTLPPDSVGVKATCAPPCLPPLHCLDWY